jgi:cell division protein FtsI (penicillin-binding protein 3)
MVPHLKDFQFTPTAQSTRSVIGAPRRLRFVVLAAIFVLWTLLIVVRLAWLQLGEHKKFLDIAAQQQQHGFEIAPRRGVLYDRNMHELAMTVSVDSVFAVPSEIKDKAATAEALAKVVHADPTEEFTTGKQIAARLQDSRNFAWVARKLDPDVIAKVKALKLKGIYFQKEFKRIYPNDELAAQVLGYVGTDDTGLGGIERKFDGDLHGTPGHMLTSVDAKRHVLGSLERDPLPGENLQLSVDENIQFMAEKALDHAMEKYKAHNGTVVVQDVHTGQILALAIRPTFNPNDFRHATNGLLRNHAVSDIYEPGSTFKLVTYSAALDAHVITPDTVIDCQGSVITLFGRTIHDDRGDHFGRLTASEALWHSSNVGAIKVALGMGREKFYSYMRAYGFGARSGIELPAETRGILRPTQRWGATSIASLAIGQEVGVTPVQLVSMVSAIANGGTYLPPHIIMNTAGSTNASLQAQPFHPHGELPKILPEGSHRVISPLVSAEMRKMMEGIVLYGTGRTAALNGYSAGGKTGTAQKIDIATHKYSKTNVVASFAGFAPVNNPAISVAVIVDSPQGEHHGAFVSAPVFAEVAQQTLEYLGVPHDEPMKPQKELDADHNAPSVDDEVPEDDSDLQAMFAEVNNLPADDPLRAPQNSQLPAPAAADGSDHVVSTMPTSLATLIDTEVPQYKAFTLANLIPAHPAKVKEDLTPQKNPETSSSGEVRPHAVETAKPLQPDAPIITDAKRRVSVPSFVGEPLRKVVETAGVAGLGVQLLGDGIARDQAPAAGTLVPLGTEVVVRFRP